MFLVSTPLRSLILNKAIGKVFLDNLNNHVISDKLIHDIVNHEFSTQDIVYGIFFITITYTDLMYYFKIDSSVRKLKTIELYNVTSKYTHVIMILLYILLANNVEDAS